MKHLILVGLILSGFILNAQSLSVSKTNLVLKPFLGSSDSFQIVSDSEWGIYNIPSWVVINTDWGNGDSTISVTAYENPYIFKRVATITIYCLNIAKQVISEVNVTITQQASGYGIADTTLNIGGEEGSSVNFTVYSNTYWEITSIPPWLSVNKNYITGTAIVSITASENPLIVTRTGFFQIRRISSNDSQWVYSNMYVTQNASVYGTSLYTLTLEAGGNSSGNFTVFSNSSWRITGYEDWIKPNPISSSGYANVTVTATKNPEIYYRTDTLDIPFGNGKTYQVVVYQKPSEPELGVNPTPFTIPDSVASSLLNIESNTNWGVGSYPVWTSIPEIFGYGNSNIEIVGEINPYTVPRKSDVNLYWLDADGSFYADTNITVFQKASTYGVSDSVLEILSAQNSKVSFSIAIPTGSYWETTNLPTWLSIDKNYQLTGGTVTITATENPLTTKRIGWFTVEFWRGTELISAKIVVTQKASLYGVSNNYIEITSAGGNTSFNISSNTSWSISGQDSWINVNPTASSGNSSVILNVQQNTTIYYRSDTLNILFSGGKTIPVVVIQYPAQATFSITPKKLIFNWVNNSSVSVNISSNTEWGIINLPTWLTSSPEYGVGNKSFTYYATQNTGNTTKFDSLLTYWIDEYNVYNQQWIVVAQKAQPITQSINLAKGWNLFSIYVQPQDSSISSVFSSSLGSIEIIRNANNYYRSANSIAFNNLKYIEQGKGYLVKTTQAVTIYITGSPSIMTMKEYRALMLLGWNIVGYPFNIQKPVTEVFDQSTISVLKDFSGFFIPGDATSTLSQLSPSKAYFVKVK